MVIARWVTVLVAGGLLAASGLAGCAAVNLPNVSLTATGPDATPPVLGALNGDGPVTSASDWLDRRAPALRQAFQAQVYGAMPAPVAAEVKDRQVLAESAFGGRGRLENWLVVAGPAQFNMAVALPRDATGPVPIIVMQNFCANPAALAEFDSVPDPIHPAPGMCENPIAKPISTTIFGLHVLAPPYERVLQAGYGVAMFYAGDIVPDDDATAEPILAQLTPPGTPPDQRTGAIAAWAWGFSRAVDVLGTDPRVSADQIAVWGHSRFGKAALLATAFDPRISTALAIQSGTGGASLQHNEVGESIAQITGSYPHWFAPAYARFAGRDADLPLDQHQLLALIAPRPMFIASARRDAWSDPHGSWRALEAVGPVYALLGRPTTRGDRIDQDTGSGPVVYFLRNGLHGVHRSDWEASLAFLAAQWGR